MSSSSLSSLNPHPRRLISGVLLPKVPEIIAFFWLTKVATTAMGETTSDWMNGILGPAIAVSLMLIALVWTLRRQFRADRYEAWTCWSVVVMVAIFGTSAADALHVGLGIPYLDSTIFYSVVLALIFAAWYRGEGTLSIHSVRTRRREAFYWATVLATFALGTAAGDMTATSLHLGYLGSIVLFAALIAVPLVGYRRFAVGSGSVRAASAWSSPSSPCSSSAGRRRRGWTSGSRRSGSANRPRTGSRNQAWTGSAAVAPSASTLGRASGSV